MGWALAWRLARREMRGGIRGFRVFLAGLALGVAAIAGVGSLADAVTQSLRDDARVLLGGDVELSFTHRRATPEQLRHLEAAGTVSTVAEMRAMSRAGDHLLLVELKGTDAAYPLAGAVRLRGERSLARALEKRDGAWGTAVERAALERLGIAVGDRLRVNDAEFVVRAEIEGEPDRTANVFTLGPRVMIALAALPETGLLQPGALVRWQHRVALDPGVDAASWTRELRQRFPEAGWRIRGLGEAAPGIQRWVDRIAMFLTLVGLTALLVGGVGVAGAVRNFVDGKTTTIATLKCLGAPGAVVMRVYMLQVLAMALLGIAIGLTLGATLPLFAAPAMAGRLGIALAPGLHAAPLALAGAYGLLTALAFSLWPLAAARDVPGAALFRALVAPPLRRPRVGTVLATGAALLAIAALAVTTALDPKLGLAFVGGAAATFALFRGAALAIAALARRWSPRGQPALRLALANLHRPGSAMPGIVLALGLGLTVLVLIAQVQGNFARALGAQIPAIAPSFFFIDIQPDQLATFDRIVAATPGAGGVQRVPALRGRITALNGVPVERAVVAQDAQWATGSDRGLTYAPTPPEGTRIVAGAWWPADYAGPPLVSLDAQIARGMGLGVGDTITINVLGRDVTATVANLRAIDWTSLGINFTLVFAPGTLEGAPQTWIATAQAAPGTETALERAVVEALPNVSAIRVREALAAVEKTMQAIGAAARATASVTLLAGTLTLAGAVAAAQRRRIYDATVLKVLGARRRDVLRAPSTLSTVAS